MRLCVESFQARYLSNFSGCALITSHKWHFYDPASLNNTNTTRPLPPPPSPPPLLPALQTHTFLPTERCNTPTLMSYAIPSTSGAWHTSGKSIRGGNRLLEQETLQVSRLKTQVEHSKAQSTGTDSTTSQNTLRWKHHCWLQRCRSVCARHDQGTAASNQMKHCRSLETGSIPLY